MTIHIPEYLLATCVAVSAASLHGCTVKQASDGSDLGGQPDGSGDDDGDDGNDDDDGDDGNDDDDDDDDDDNDDDDDGPLFDIGPPEGDPDDGGGCDKVDFLFVVDNSGSMADEQQNLINSFPGFMDGIKETLTANDFHVMVIDTDSATPPTSTTCINADCTCEPVADCCATVCEEMPTADTCNGKDCDSTEFDACDTTLGAGKRYNSETGEACSIDGEQRYLLTSQSDLGETFACIARAGISGSGDELTMAGMIEAVGETLNKPGGCNEDFIRDDALLVVTFITDEEDIGKSPGGPANWRDALVKLKGGDDKMVVVVGFIGDLDLPGGLCQGDAAEASPRLRQFVRSFGDQGLDASVCAPDYAPYFVQAIDIIDTACDDVE